MKIKFLIEKLSVNKNIYVLWQKLEASDNLGFKANVGTTFEEVIEYVRRLLKNETLC